MKKSTLVEELMQYWQQQKVCHPLEAGPIPEVMQGFTFKCRIASSHMHTKNKRNLQVNDI